jgi:hypothetical protein
MFDINEFILSLQSSGKMFQTRDTPILPNISHNELLEIASLFSYDDVLASMRKKESKFVWHVAAPKSGSTWLTNSLAKIALAHEWETPFISVGGGNRAQELNVSELARLKILDKNILGLHQHCLCSDYTLNVISKFNIKVILQVRNIKDCLVSLKDHLDKESVVKPLFYMNDYCWSKLSAEGSPHKSAIA